MQKQVEKIRSRKRSWGDEGESRDKKRYKKKHDRKDKWEEVLNEEA